MMNLLLVEDFPRLHTSLAAVLRDHSGIHLIDIANDCEQAIRAIRQTAPKLVIVDLQLSMQAGLDATRQIMETCPVPVVMINSNCSPADSAMRLQATTAGALMILPRPRLLDHPAHNASVGKLLANLALMTEVKVVRRRPQRQSKAVVALPFDGHSALTQARIVALGASTGGPVVLQRVLQLLPANFPVPIVIVQHMATGFARGFVDWLAKTSKLPVAIATNGDRLRPGHVYLAPDDHQLRVVHGERIRLNSEHSESGLRPSIACLFKSVAEIYGDRTIAGLLTGMGRDGAVELKLLRDRGATTFVQDKSSSVVHGMAGQALALDAATLVLPAEQIAAVLTALLNPVKKFSPLKP